MQLLSILTDIFHVEGSSYYGGEAVSQLQHALQAASLAETDGASRALIVAALLHDVGHLLGAGDEGLSEAGIDARHEVVGSRFLGRWFGPAVTEPVRLHVRAKSYLCHIDPDYYNGLTQASRDSLAVQGGAFDASRAETFADEPFHADAVRLRRWDDRAKVAGAATPGLGHYLRIAVHVAATS